MLFRKAERHISCAEKIERIIFTQSDHIIRQPEPSIPAAVIFFIYILILLYTDIAACGMYIYPRGALA